MAGQEPRYDLVNPIAGFQPNFDSAGRQVSSSGSLLSGVVPDEPGDPVEGGAAFVEKGGECLEDVRDAGRLQEAGLCARRANPSDRRSSIVELTPKGKALLAIAAPVFDRGLDRLLRAPLPGADLTQLADALGTLRQSAANQAGSPAAGGAPSNV
jgi:hypothetical protein